nr:hypothetical protein [Geoanaerobacter pelophilus]
MNYRIFPRPTPWEIEQLLMIDQISLKVYGEKTEDTADKPAGKRR